MRNRARQARPSALIVVLLAVVLVLGAGVASYALLRNDDSADRSAAAEPKSYAALAAANYRVLSPAATRRLLTFADALYSCMSAHGSALGKPKPLTTKLEMRLPANEPARKTLRLMAQCGDGLGGPPKDASLILRGRVVELYLPKQCLLDRKVVASHSA